MNQESFSSAPSITGGSLLSNRFLPLLICLAGFSIRLLCIIFCEYGIYSDADEFMEIALNLIAGKGYYLDGGTSAYRMPGYPLALAFLNLISNNLIWLKTVQALGEIATGYVIYLIAKRHFNELPAIIALIVWSFLPVSVVQPLTFMSEGLFTLLFVLMVYVLTGKAGYRSAIIGGGLLCGALTLIKPQMMLFPGVFLAILLLRKVRLISALKYAVVFSLLTAVALAPWILRNKRQFGEFIISTNGGQNLYVGNNPDASGSYYDVPRASHPELPIDREFRKKAITFIMNNPVAVMKLIPKKIAYLFSLESASAILLHFKGKIPEDLSYGDAYRATPVWMLVVFNLPYILITLAALWACFLLAPRIGFLREIILIILFWVAIHAVYFGASRFHYPLLPLFTLAAVSMSVLKTVGKVKPPAMAGGAVASLLLIALWLGELVVAYR